MVTFSAALQTQVGTIACEPVSAPDRPEANDILVDIAASGVCHSDARVLRGEWSAPMPIVLGHEGAGTVRAVGSAVTGIAPGDEVVLTWTPPCGRCRFCASGRVSLCDVAKSRASRHVLPDGRPALSCAGEPVHTYIGLGTMAEVVHVPASAAVRIPPGSDPHVACIVGCAVTTGVGAAIVTGACSPADDALVIGCGGVGLSAIQGTRAAGARRRVAADVLGSRSAAALECGAHEFVDLTTTRIDEFFDLVVEASGHPDGIALALERVAKGGRVVFVGQPATGLRVPLDVMRVADQEIRLLGCNYGSASPHRDIPRYLDWGARGQLDLAALVGEIVDLGGAAAALSAVGGDTGRRTVIRLASA